MKTELLGGPSPFSETDAADATNATDGQVPVPLKPLGLQLAPLEMSMSGDVLRLWQWGQPGQLRQDNTPGLDEMQ